MEPICLISVYAVLLMLCNNCRDMLRFESRVAPWFLSERTQMEYIGISTVND